MNARMGSIPPGRTGIIVLAAVVATVIAKKAVPFLGKVGEEVEKFGRGMRLAAERDAERLRAEQAQRVAEPEADKPATDEVIVEFHDDIEITPEPEPVPVAGEDVAQPDVEDTEPQPDAG